VRAASVEEGLTPTMAEREQPQLLLVSTAHRLATGLMLSRRQQALGDLEGGGGDLLIEWSAPRDADLRDVGAWRLASPHWTPQRERLIGKRLQAALDGETQDPEEPDPEQSFRAQWLNQWPTRKVEAPGAVQDLLPAGLWGTLEQPDLEGAGPVFVAVEDDFGLGAAVAAVAVLEDGRLEVDGWLREDWNTAIADVQRLGELREIRELHVGASLLDRSRWGCRRRGRRSRPRPGTGSRCYGTSRRAASWCTTRRRGTSTGRWGRRGSKESLTGLFLVAVGPTHLVKAAAWALAAAHRPAAFSNVSRGMSPATSRAERSILPIRSTP
jgi:hypothetical protein